MCGCFGWDLDCTGPGFFGELLVPRDRFFTIYDLTIYYCDDDIRFTMCDVQRVNYLTRNVDRACHTLRTIERGKRGPSTPCKVLRTPYSVLRTI